MSTDICSIVVLAGGLSHERDVSLRSGRRVAQALRDTGHQVIEADVTGALADLLAGTADPVVFPVLHGGDGEDGSLRQVLDLFEVPYVGSTGPASQRAFDKSICTPLLHVRTPAQVALPNSVFRELGAPALVRGVVDRLGLPLMVKPSRSGSALGCTKVERVEALPGALMAAYAYGEMAVIEEFIEGTEVAVTVIDTGAGPRALPAVEIRPRSGVYDYTARYTAGETRFLCPAEVSDETARDCADLALGVHRQLGLRDLSRTDIIIGAQGPTFIETNVSPGMTETALVPLSVAGARPRPGADMPLRMRQALVIALGVVAAAVMTWLGFWQLQVFTDQGNASVQARAHQPAVALLDQVSADGTVGDIYGKPVVATGRYLAGQQQRVLGEDGTVRVLSAFRLADGRVLPVVRGVIAQGVDAPAAPTGELTQTGLFLASEAGTDRTLATGYDLGSVRLAQLAQLWPWPLLPGFITLDAAEAARQGLQPATVTLPTGEGSWRNSGYALQWWVFALFGLGMTIKIAQGMGKRERAAAAFAQEASADGGSSDRGSAD